MRAALQLLGKDVGPLVLKVHNQQLLVDEGLPPIDRICGGCGGSHYYGRLAEVERPTKTHRVGDQARFRCDPCQRRVEKYRVAREELVRRINEDGLRAEPVEEEEVEVGPDAS